MNASEGYKRLDQLDSITNVREYPLSEGMKVYCDSTLRKVYSEKHPYILMKLIRFSKNLKGLFPYEEIRKLKNDWGHYLSEDDCLSGDLNTYWMSIYGSALYIAKGKSMERRKKNVEFLTLSFFNRFKQYKPLEQHINQYPLFYREYMNHEKVRVLILYYSFCRGNRRYRNKGFR